MPGTGKIRTGTSAVGALASQLTRPEQEANPDSRSGQDPVGEVFLGLADAPGFLDLDGEGEVVSEAACVADAI